MTDNSAPGVFTQPDGDADDVLGHRAAFDKKADRAAAHDDVDDVEGHKKADRVVDRVMAHDDDADDVEGHRKL